MVLLPARGSRGMKEKGGGRVERLDASGTRGGAAGRNGKARDCLKQEMSQPITIINGSGFYGRSCKSAGRRVEYRVS